MVVCFLRHKSSWMYLRQLLLIACVCPPGLVWAIAGVEVEITGLEHPLRENVRAYLSIAEGEDEQDGAEIPDETVQRLHMHANGEIRQALRPFGYYSPRIQTKLERKDDGWLARYHIDAGPPTIVRQVEIRVEGEGRQEAAVQEALSSVKLKEGERLEHGQYKEAKDALYDAAYSAGYLDARYRRSELLVYPETQRAEIYLMLKTGPKYYFGPVTIEQDILRPEFVERFLPFKPGDPFDIEKLLDLQLALSDSGYFDRVELRPKKKRAENQRVPVTVITEPSRPQQYTIGVGYGTDTGPRLSLGVQLRRINRRGHRFRADLQLSTIKNTLSAQYQIPIKNVATDSLTFAATLQQEEIGDADTEQFILGVSRNELWRGFQRRLYLNYQRENFSFGDRPNQQADLLYPGMTLTRKRADDPLFARSGYSVSLDLHGGNENLLSETTFLRTLADFRAVFPLGSRSRLLLHTETGAMVADEFIGLPPSQRFFTGGDRSVRGYDYQDIGPRNAAGDTIGGRYLLAGGIEADYRVYGDFGAAVFFDAGDAFNDTPDPKLGAGVGFRWFSPVGMVRLDFAHPFDDPDDDFRFHLSIGPDL
jgi:translocation and assembly module TamA